MIVPSIPGALLCGLFVFLGSPSTPRSGCPRRLRRPAWGGCWPFQRDPRLIERTWAARSHPRTDRSSFGGSFRALLGTAAGGVTASDLTWSYVVAGCLTSGLLLLGAYSLR
ncbi:MAG: hypothetical protein R3F62_10565 [Planctomycetota bacterium]